MKIAVVGAQGTGKTSLVAALQLALQADTDPIAFTLIKGGALEQHPRYDLTLLMGLDLPGPSVQHHGLTAAQCDGQLRQFMQQHAITYAVVYGSGQNRTDCALQAIAYLRKQASTRRSPAAASAWQWCCETCSDAACEHRLFTALVKPPILSVGL